MSPPSAFSNRCRSASSRGASSWRPDLAPFQPRRPQTLTEVLMASVDMAIMLNAPAQKVWDLIGGFDALPRWLPPVAKSEERKEGDTTRRHLSLQGGGVIIEKL